MAVEIECKARISNPEKLAKKLSALAVFQQNFEKNDIYYIREKEDSADYGIRLRRESIQNYQAKTAETCIVTWKSKTIKDAIEINDEREFQVSSGKAFEEFLLSLGFAERNRKKKTGAAYLKDNMTAELTMVHGLGWFIELEILLPKSSGINVEEEKERLLAFLDSLEIPRSAVEKRPYSQMLRENNNAPSSG